MIERKTLKDLEGLLDFKDVMEALVFAMQTGEEIDLEDSDINFKLQSIYTSSRPNQWNEFESVFVNNTDNKATMIFEHSKYTLTLKYETDENKTVKCVDGEFHSKVKSEESKQETQGEAQ